MAALTVAASALPLSSVWAAEDVLDALGPESLDSSVGRVLGGSEFSCRPDRTDPDIRRCTSAPDALWAVSGVGVTSVEALVKGGSLMRVAIYFPELRFPQMLLALSARLGDGRDWTVSIRSGMAGQLSDQIRIWETNRFALVAQQFDRKIDRSSLTYGSVDAMAPLLRQIQSTPRGALRDL